MATKFGFQCQTDSGHAERYNRELRPTHVMLINVAKREFLERLKADNPGVKLIYRHWPNYDWGRPTPEEAAIRAVAELKAEITPILDLLDYVTDNNEYILSRDHVPPADIEAGDRYVAAFIKEARRVLGLGTCWGNFNTGHWGQETVDYFPLALASANEDGDSPICFHEYNWPAIPDPEYWTCGKVLRAMPPIRAQYPNVHCAVTEFGTDDGGDPHRGWKLAHEDYAQAVKIFCDGVVWYRDEVMAKAAYLDAVLFFGCGMVSPWESFDVAPIIDDIKAALGTAPEPGPEPEEPPMTDDITVIDKDNQERDFAWAKDKYGVGFRRAQVAAGKKVYRLVELREKTGSSALVTTVVDANGSPLQNKDVAFYWPNAPDPPEPDTEAYPHDWYPNFVHGLTNANGDVGPGMGHGAYHGEGQGGPHAVWVRDPVIPSDICEKLGMLAGTFHDHLDQKFAPVTAGEEPEEPVTHKLEQKSRIVIIPWPSAEMVLKYPKKKPDGTDFATDTRGQARIKNVPPTVYDPDLELPFTLDGYAAVKNCCDYSGMGPRTYQLMVTRYGASEAITPVVEESFAPSPDHRRVIFTVDWVEEEEPEPPAPPPSDDIAAILRDDADALRAVVVDVVDVAADLDAIADIVSESGEVVNVVVTYQDGRQSTFKPATGLVSAIKSLFGR